MPVISCPDCGRDVSTLAPVCPHCGRPSPAGTVPIAAAPPAVQEETLWRGTPSPRLLVGKLVIIVLTLIVVPLGARWAASVAPDLEASSRMIRMGWWVTAALLLIEAIALVLALVRLRSTLFTITSQRVMIERGLLSKSLSEIDLRYVDDTQFAQGIVDRMLGVGNVTLVSSDKTSPVYVLQGIRDPRAIREMIRSNAYRVSQRQIFTRAT